MKQSKQSQKESILYPVEECRFIRWPRQGPSPKLLKKSGKTSIWIFPDGDLAKGNEADEAIEEIKREHGINAGRKIEESVESEVEAENADLAASKEDVGFQKFAQKPGRQ